MTELRKNIFLHGNSIYLRALLESDLSGNYQFWLNDEEIVRYNSHGRFPYSLDQLKSYISSSTISNVTLVLAVIVKEINAHIGNISLNSINWIDRNAEIAFLLGEKDYWGKGIMEEAGHLLIEHAFKTLNLHRIHCGTSSENLGMQKLALKLGMTQEGIRKEALFKMGKYLDILEYGMINPNEVL